MKKVLFILISFICCDLFSQVYSYKNYTEDEGLSQSFVNDLCQDDKGFLYIATGDGLSTYGGNTFKIYRMSNGLHNDFVTSVFKDSKNSMWLGHLEGKVSIINTYGNVDRVKFQEDIGSKIIQIIEVSPNNYVFLKNHTGLITYNAAKRTYVNIEHDEFNEILSLVVNKDEIIALKPDGVYSIKIKNLLDKKYKLTQLIKLNEGVLMQLNMAKDRIIVADNRSGVIIYKNDSKFTPIDTFKIRKNESSVFRKLISDRHSNIYIATTENGYYKIIPSTKELLNFTTKNGVNSNAVECIYVDREDNLWVGTYGSGLQQLNSELFSYKNIIDNDGHFLTANAVVKINNRLVAATKIGLGYLVEDKVIFANDPRVANKNITCLHRHKSNLVFCTSDGELFVSDSLLKSITKIPVAAKTVKLFFNAISSDDNYIYGCTSSGLFAINDVNYEYKLLNTETGLLHNDVRYAFPDSKKHLWICSPGTLIYYIDSLKKIKRFQDVRGLEKFSTISVCEDSDKNIWISTIGDGVFKYSRNRFENFTTKDGLKSNYCYGIAADKKNGIWITHTNGISYKEFQKKNFNKIVVGYNLTQSRFIENSDFFEKNTQEFLFGTSTGIAQINTNKQHYNEIEPALNILSVFINGRKVDLFADTLLSYNSYNLEIEFNGVCLTDPTNVKYKYKLEGLQDNWEFLTYEVRKVQFPKLQDGEYTLMLYSSNNDDLWNSDPISFKIKVQNPYWKNFWFYVILIVVLALVFFILIKLRTKTLLAEQRKLEEIIIQKTSEVVAEKEKIEDLFTEIQSKNKDITDSINYAKRIQEALLPLESYIKEGFDAACFYRPKDIVSGDFYWFKKTPKYSFMAAVDCTGHGVPGAFMSFIGSTILDEIVTANQDLNPAEILHKLDVQVSKVLNQHSREGELNVDGMDISICKYTPKTKVLEFSGAVRTIYIHRDKELHKFKSGPYSIGGAFKDLEKPFILNTWTVKPGDNMYLFSDGFVDQSGGEKGKKYSSARLASFFSEIADLSTKEQKERMTTEFDTWMGDEQQVDDVLVLSIKF